MSRAYRAPAIGRAVETLQLLAERARPVTLSEVARELGYGKSTILGILRSLAGMGLAEICAAIGDDALPRFTERTVTDPGDFLREIEQTRERGYGVDDEEYLKGVRAVVAPVRCYGATVAALWIAGCSATLADGRFAAAARQRVREAEACGGGSDGH